MTDFKLTLKPIAKDARGESYSLMFPDGKEAVLIFTKAGFLRGGHSHTTPEVSLLLSGSVKCWKIINGTEYTFTRKKGETLANRAGEPHLTLFLEDSWLLDWKSEVKAGEWETINYEPYRKQVDEQLKEIKN